MELRGAFVQVGFPGLHEPNERRVSCYFGTKEKESEPALCCTFVPSFGTV